MTFYLLQSSKEVYNAGDVLLDTSRIESIQIANRVIDGKSCFSVLFDMYSQDRVQAHFASEDEAKKIIKDVLKDKVTDEQISRIIVTFREDKLKKLKEVIDAL